MEPKAVEQENAQASKNAEHPGFFGQVLEVDSSSVTPDYVFDNIRNYTFATTILIAGLWLFAQDDTFLGIPYVNQVFGIHVVICGLALMGLNFVHSVRTIARAPGRTWPGYVIYLTLLVGSLEIAWISFWKFYH